MTTIEPRRFKLMTYFGGPVLGIFGLLMAWLICHLAFREVALLVSTPGPGEFTPQSQWFLLPILLAGLVAVLLFFASLYRPVAVVISDQHLILPRSMSLLRFIPRTIPWMEIDRIGAGAISIRGLIPVLVLGSSHNVIVCVKSKNGIVAKVDLLRLQGGDDLLITLAARTGLAPQELSAAQLRKADPFT